MNADRKTIFKFGFLLPLRCVIICSGSGAYETKNRGHKQLVVGRRQRGKYCRDTASVFYCKEK